MDREKLQSFIQTAEVDIASIRSSLLIVAQTGDVSDLSTPRRGLSRLQNAAGKSGLVKVANLSSDGLAAIENLSTTSPFHPKLVYSVLDIVARTEASLWNIPVGSGDSPSDFDGIVDGLFDDINLRTPNNTGSRETHDEFEIDEETFDIFRTEAEELLSNISESIKALYHRPDDQKALWNIRRNAHTLKGAAGVVGLKEAADVAHRMEDLLDKIVETDLLVEPQVVDFLDASAIQLKAIAVNGISKEDSGILDKKYADSMSSVSFVPDSNSRKPSLIHDHVSENFAVLSDKAKSNSSPIVRVSLDRLDEVIRLSRTLQTNRSDLADKITEFISGSIAISDFEPTIESLFETQRNLACAIHEKLLRIRMVRFGTLETRLSRAVNVACFDEKKKAQVTVVNGDIEIDTQIIDALVEPLLHLLKNAVVHGIESPETRRLIGKPEQGGIRVLLDKHENLISISVSDDGGGISVQKLKGVAIAKGIVSVETAMEMDDTEALNLIFDRGLSTADKIDHNAGRGVGMSIVKESVESRGGSVEIKSEPQHGTTITIRMPDLLAEIEIESDIRRSNNASEQPLLLIVDDSESIRGITSVLARKLGTSVVTAKDGAEAFGLLSSGNRLPDLILSDVEMPELNGWELLESIRSHRDFRKIPVILITSLVGDEYRIRAINLGASDYLSKPLKQKDLEKALHELGLVKNPTLQEVGSV